MRVLGVVCLVVLGLVVVDELRTWVRAVRRRRAAARARAHRVRFYSRGRSGLDVVRDGLGVTGDGTPRRRRGYDPPLPPSPGRGRGDRGGDPF